MRSAAEAVHAFKALTLALCSIALYDVRADTPLRKLVMLKRANKVAWNPREAFNFTVASEDNNLYSFDMRKLDIATNVHKDFVSVRSSACAMPSLVASDACSETQAVMDVDYSPTGREFVAGAYDRSVRIFAYNGGRSREVYHTKRMQRCVLSCMLLCLPLSDACSVAQRLRGALQRRRRVCLQRQRGHERAYLEGGGVHASRPGACSFVSGSSASLC